MGAERTVDSVLKSGKRSLRTIPGAGLLGPTGSRLWADFLWSSPGFTGAIDFIHKLNLPSLFTVQCDIVKSYEPNKVNWYPSHMTMEFSNNHVHLQESKFITWDDCAVSCQTWKNIGQNDVFLKLVPNEQLFQSIDSSYCSGSFEAAHYDFTLISVLSSNHAEIGNGIVLQPGQSVELVIATAFGLQETENETVLEERARYWTALSPEAATILQSTNYQTWFDEAPSFISNEPLLNKTWLYRWFLLRHNLADPRCGSLQHPLFYEGRSHKMSKTPYKPSGWEFSKMIPLTVPMHILEARWYPKQAYTEGPMRNMKASQGDDGLYKCLFVNKTLHSYANFMGWAVYQQYLINRDSAVIEEMLPSLKSQIRGESEALGNSFDRLLTEYTHNRTGKEYQPSYWYFHNYPDDCKNPEQFTPLKRVDRAIYHYLNCLGVAQLCRILDDPEADRFEQLALSIKQDVLTKMWDESTQFFYDLHYETDEKAKVKNIVGFYPFWAQITNNSHADGMKHVMNEQEFRTPSPFPSVSADCPVYQSEGSWKGHFIKGRNGCMWNGPTWPYTNSIVLDAIALESKQSGHNMDEAFGELFREYSLLHYRGRDLDAPYLVEHYSSATGEPISDEVDYNHSYYIDLVIQHIAGLKVEVDRFILHPIDIGLAYFELDRIEVAGHKLTITYHNGDYPETGIPTGYRLYVDGELAVESEKLEAMEYVLDDNNEY